MRSLIRGSIIWLSLVLTAALAFAGEPFQTVKGTYLFFFHNAAVCMAMIIGVLSAVALAGLLVLGVMVLASAAMKILGFK